MYNQNNEQIYFYALSNEEEAIYLTTKASSELETGHNSCKVFSNIITSLSEEIIQLNTNFYNKGIHMNALF